jgi:SPP1 gp7 family putative phage head morphogenesis protein
MMHRSTALYAKALQDMAEATLANDHAWEQRTVESLADLLQHSLAYSNLLGRRRLLLEADAVRKYNPPTDAMMFDAESGEGVTVWEVRADTPMVPHVPFEEAIEDLYNRDPRIIDREAIDRYRQRYGIPEGAPDPPKYKIVQDFYSRDHVFALARSNQEHVTKNIQKTIGQMMDRGETVDTAAGKLRKKAILAGQDGWSRAYAETTFRTNINGAYNSGLREMASDEAVASVIGGFEYNAIRDPDTRKSHRAADGLIAGTSNPIWDRFTPPLGYNCRCALRLIGRDELERRELVKGGIVEVWEPRNFANARPDPGFNGEPQR